MAEDEILQEDTADTEPEIYTGPNILAFGLTQFQVFRGGLPLFVARAYFALTQPRKSQRYES